MVRRIKRDRGAQGLKLAKLAGVVRRTVSSVEHGKGASLTTFIALLRGLEAVRELERIHHPERHVVIELELRQVAPLN